MDKHSAATKRNILPTYPGTYLTFLPKELKDLLYRYVYAPNLGYTLTIRLTSHSSQADFDICIAFEMCDWVVHPLCLPYKEIRRFLLDPLQPIEFKMGKYSITSDGANVRFFEDLRCVYEVYLSHSIVLLMEDLLAFVEHADVVVGQWF